MKSRLTIRRHERIFAYVQILVGCAISALSFPMFLVQYDIAPGGVTGIATVLHYLFSFPIGLTSLALNVPLFIMGYRLLGRIFAFRTLIATIVFSLFIDWLPVMPFPADMLLSAVFGGVLLGLGLGLILRGGATTGGSDLTAKMIHARFQHISVGMILFAIDFCVVISAAFLITPKAALYALITIFISSRVIDMVVQGFERHKACYIITQYHETIKQKLMDSLQRGITVFYAKGGFSDADHPVLLCIISAQELAKLKLIVRMEDEKAFVFITAAHEVLGEGFDRLDESK
ncbi:MAG TPA: YitT family protein [Candidatus Limiplasma sp.]|nr:YitT family protein [Candidatus Limiplasma sp.]HRX08892.1 YitT family protein [Candidatus Limiplasma sp.]